MKDLTADLGRLFGRWTLWSPKRLILVGLGVVVAIVVFASCTGGPAKSKPGPSIPRPWNSPSASPSALPPSAKDVVIPPAVTVSPAPPPDAIGTAVLFVTAWADKTDAGHIPTQGHPGWLAGAQKYADKHLADGLSFTDPSRIASTRVIGPGTILATGEGGKMIQVPTDAGTWVVTVVPNGTSWLVDGIDRAP